jgi:hypothetical protein
LRSPSEVGELVVVPHTRNGQRTRVLQIGIGEIAAIEDAVIPERRRDVEVADLLAAR